MKFSTVFSLSFITTLFVIAASFACFKIAKVYHGWQASQVLIGTPMPTCKPGEHLTLHEPNPNGPSPSWVVCDPDKE